MDRVWIIQQTLSVLCYFPKQIAHLWNCLRTAQSQLVDQFLKIFQCATSSLSLRVVMWTPNSSAFSLGAKIERVLNAASACLNKSSMSNLQQHFFKHWSPWFIHGPDRKKGKKYQILPHSDCHFDFLLQLDGCSLHVVVFPQRFQLGVRHVKHSRAVQSFLLKVLPSLKIVCQTILPLLCFFVRHLEKNWHYDCS